MRYRFYDEQREEVPIRIVEEELLERLDTTNYIPSVVLEFELLVLVGTYATARGRWDNERFEYACFHIGIDGNRKDVYKDFLYGKYRFESFY